MTLHPALRLTPSNSPFFKSPSPRSPTKQRTYEEPGLHLNKVIGTTTASGNGFDCLSTSRQFAFTAGAAAVVATVDEDLNVTQQFFRATPGATSGTRDGAYGWPGTPTPSEPRYKALGRAEQGNGGSPLSNSTRDWPDSPSGRSTTAKDRVKAATSVALNCNGNWLAVGETGYKPRILIFSIKEGSSEAPTTILSEHTFGVHALRFSPDSKFLASLGTVNDGFLHVWSFDDRTGAATLQYSNKCTSTTYSLSWMGSSVLCAGLRFIKMWRLDEDASSDNRGSESPRSKLTPRPKPITRASELGNSVSNFKPRLLQGKNFLLGDLLEAIFVAIVPISESKALVCADSGEICLLNDEDKSQNVTFMVDAGFRITAARLDGRGTLHVTGPNESSVSFDVSELESRPASFEKGQRRSSNFLSRASAPGDVSVIATASIDDIIVDVNSNRTIELWRHDIGTPDRIKIPNRQLCAHQDSVLGVQPFHSTSLPNAAFLTFSGNGTIHFWDENGVSISGLNVPIENSPEMYGLTNELRAVAPLPKGKLIATGDKYGMVALADVKTKKILQQVRGHSAEVLDIIAFDRSGVSLLASASRDRTVQLFSCESDKLELLQTMDEHAGAVTSLLFHPDKDYLLSCSSDRTVVLREGIFRNPEDPKNGAFGIVRTITLKSAPTSMCFMSQEDAVLIATVDRCIGKYSTRSGQAGFTFKCSDADGGEAAVLSNIAYMPSLNGNPAIAGISSTDKSVRIYTEYGSLIARDWGHTEGITDMAVIENSRSNPRPTTSSSQLVTVAADSTIFLWECGVSNSRSNSQVMDNLDIPNTNNAAPLAPPLRKVISFSEFSRFRGERSTEGTDLRSSTTVAATTPSQDPSPPKLRKKTSRMSVAQPPRLEPAFRSNTDLSRRRSMWQRSPSPPSPRHASKKEPSRWPSLGMSLRSKSSDTLLNVASSGTANNGGFGSLTASTESVCRTLRTYRKKLSSSNSSNDTITPDALRELEKELKLTARVLGERSHGKNIDEATMTKLLDQASDKIVDLLGGRIQERIGNEVRRNGDGSSTPLPQLDESAEHSRATGGGP